jgi:hypothetical protein
LLVPYCFLLRILFLKLLRGNLRLLENEREGLEVWLTGRTLAWNV